MLSSLPAIRKHRHRFGGHLRAYTDQRSLGKVRRRPPTIHVHLTVVPKAARMDRLIAVPHRAMVETTMAKEVNEVPVDLIHELRQEVNIVEQAPVHLTEIPILGTLIVHRLLVAVDLDQVSLSSSSPTKRIILFSRTMKGIPSGRLMCASLFMLTDSKWCTTWNIGLPLRLTTTLGDRSNDGCT